ncbi:MAG: zinc-ribbon domain-containing protein [Firmicutes bacterium]|nr:zinc-ribbon domain-containing protein [Bacillota bacterium]
MPKETTSFYDWCIEHKKSELLKEWNYKKNKDISPKDYARGSDKKVWWICEHGHEWQAGIGYRTAFGIPCPVCNKTHTLVSGVNDLATLNPALAREWDYYRNSGLRPTKIMPRSMKKVWWKCEEGHSYQAIVNNRSQGSGCPICAGRNEISKKINLKIQNPKIADEWNYQKNLKGPESISSSSNKIVWWKCSKCGHEWEEKVSSRLGKNRECPECSRISKKDLNKFEDAFLDAIFKDLLNQKLITTEELMQMKADMKKKPNKESE